MNAGQKLHQAKLNAWTAAFADHKASGLTIRQWCDQNNISFHAFNYWKHLLKKEVVSQMLPDIVEVPVTAISAPHDSRHQSQQNSANCAIRANSASPSVSGTSVKLTQTVGDTVIEITSDIPSDFLCTLLKAVRYV